MSEPQLKRRLTIPRDLTSDERLDLGRSIIQFIQSRTKKGIDLNNRKFPGYSSDYTQSKDFKNAGKSRRVNLSQSGDTIASIELLSHGPGYITIGYDSGSFENDKAVWIQRSDNGMSRMFLGLTDSDLNKLVKNITARRTAKVGSTRTLTDTIVSGILKRLGL